MKVFKLFAIGVLTFAVSASFNSCGSSKVQKLSYPSYTSDGNTGPRSVSKSKIERDECENESYAAPAGELRAYASAISENREFARQKAILLAKGALVTNIEAIVSNVMEGISQDKTINGVASHEEDFRRSVKTKSESTISNCKIICSNIYQMSDGTYESTVCISVPTEPIQKILVADMAIVTPDMDVEQRTKYIDTNLLKFQEDLKKQL